MCKVCKVCKVFRASRKENFEGFGAAREVIQRAIFFRTRARTRLNLTHLTHSPRGRVFTGLQVCKVAKTSLHSAHTPNTLLGVLMLQPP